MDSSGRADDLPRGHDGGTFRDVGIRPARRGWLLFWLGAIVLLMLLVLGAFYAFNAFRANAIHQVFTSMKPPPAVVAMATAERQSVPAYLNGIGSLAAVHQVTIASQVGGMVTQILFTAGQEVKAGAPLVQLDDGPEQGDLKNFEAQARYAAVTLKRNQELATRQAAPQSTVDQNQSQLDQAKASITKTKALIAQKLIRAPFAGRLGMRQVEVGQYMNAGAAMVSLTDLSQLYVNFTLPEQNTAALQQGQKVMLGVDAYPGQTFAAVINVIEPQLGSDTRTIKVQAVMDNPDGKLLPGMFATVRVVLPPQPELVTVPETAVENTLYGDSIYVVHDNGSDAAGKPQLVAKRVPVKTGRHFNGRVAISSGVEPGDRVVAAGQNKVVYDGAPVTPSDTAGLTPPAKVPNN